MQHSSLPQPSNPVIIGIDWADREHALCVLDGESIEVKTLEHDPEAIANWIEEIRTRFSTRTILIAIEQSRGALVHALQDAQGLQIYPINPKQLANYRVALYPAGGKNDPRDAELLASFLLKHRNRLRPWQGDDILTRKISYLSELRRKVVDERKSLSLRLMGTLKLYFPLPLKLFERTPISEFIVDLLKRWPSLETLKRAHPKALRAFFSGHGISDKDRQTDWIKAIRAATPLTRDTALIDTHAILIQSIVRQIAELNRTVTEFDEHLRQAVAKHPDHAIFRALPGAGDALVPRLIAAFGSDRDRYQSAEEIQAYSGIAPITEKSGNACWVTQRFFCPKFLKQTFHEFAEQARRWSTWSRAFYELKRGQGMKHNAAVRALAFKWIRIMFRLWKTRATYSEKEYITQLKNKKSPIVPLLATT